MGLPAMGLCLPWGYACNGAMPAMGLVWRGLPESCHCRVLCWPKGCMGRPWVYCSKHSHETIGYPFFSQVSQSFCGGPIFLLCTVRGVMCASAAAVLSLAAAHACSYRFRIHNSLKLHYMRALCAN